MVYFNTDKRQRIEKIEFYDGKGDLLKTMAYAKYKLYKDKHWRASEMNVVNHQSQKETKLIFNDFDFNSKLTERDFNQSSLKRS